MNTKDSRQSLRLPAALALLAALALAGCGSKSEPSDAADAQGEKKAVPVVVRPLQRQRFEQRVELSATVRAVDEAYVSPRVGGTLEALYVDEGDAVRRGQTRLFQVDRQNLADAAEAAAQQVAVADAAIAAAEAAVQRVEADARQVELDAGRYRRLRDSGAVTAAALESQESRLQQMQAAVVEARASVALARAQAAQARSRKAIAEKDLADALVLAPLDGVVADRMAEPGESAEAGTPVLRIIDPSRLELSAYLPGEYYTRVEPGRTVVRIELPGGSVERAVDYRSPSVDERLRTFEIKVNVTPDQVPLAPGMMVRLGVVLAAGEGLAVPADAVVVRDGRQVVFVADGGRARQQAVTPGLETDGLLEIAGEGLAADQLVVVQGQRFCRDGEPVRILDTPEE